MASGVTINFKIIFNSIFLHILLMNMCTACFLSEQTINVNKIDSRKRVSTIFYDSHVQVALMEKQMKFTK